MPKGDEEMKTAGLAIQSRVTVPSHYNSRASEIVTHCFFFFIWEDQREDSVLEGSFSTAGFFFYEYLLLESAPCAQVGMMDDVR